MLKLFFSFFMSLSLVLMNFSFQTYFNIGSFDNKQVVSYIDYLSSSTFKGRLSGTLENKMVSQYIKAQFQKNNLSPYKGDYFDSFDTKYPKQNNKSPYLRVVDNKGKVVSEYNYGKDYKEDMLNFKKNSFTFNNSNPHYFSDDSIQVICGTDPFLFFTPDNDRLDFRSSFMYDSTFSMYIMVTKNTLIDIQNNIKKGYKVECSIPFDVEDIQLDNVVGVIKGKNSDKPPVILSAHFDHLGSDLGGSIYAGALDNASGTAFILEMSKYLQSFGLPDRDIIFIAFNAEEFGCLGSKAFVEKYKDELTGSKVFNFDMIGSNNSVPLSIMGSKTDTDQTSLIRSVSSSCSSTKTSYKYLFEDASDHEYFRKAGIDAITFCDNDLTRIHTPSDKPVFISTDSVERCFNVALREVVKYGYNNNLIFIYYKETLLGSILSIILLLIIHLITYKEEESSNVKMQG